MAKRGRKPKNKDAREFDGDKDKRRHVDHVEPTDGKPTPPPEILASKYAWKEWQRICPILEEMGILSNSFQGAMVAYCLCYARLMEAHQYIVEEAKGQMTYAIRNKDGTIAKVCKLPHLAIIQDASKELRQWAGELGFTPGSQAGIKKPNKKKPTGMGEFLK